MIVFCPNCDSSFEYTGDKRECPHCKCCIPEVGALLRQWFELKTRFDVEVDEARRRIKRGITLVQRAYEELGSRISMIKDNAPKWDRG